MDQEETAPPSVSEFLEIINDLIVSTPLKCKQTSPEPHSRPPLCLTSLLQEAILFCPEHREAGR